MTINLSVPSNNETPELKPRITVIGVGGAGGNAVNNMIDKELEGVDFVVANTDAQALAGSRTDRRVQLGESITQGLGAGSRPDVGRMAAEETLDNVLEQLGGSNMVFIAAGMGGGTGTGAAPVIAQAAKDQGILTVGVVTKPFQFEGAHRMKLAENGINELEKFVDTLIIIPNQNLFRIANEKTTFADAFNMADEVLYSGVRGVTDLMVMPGLINLDFADIRSVMSEMGKAMMGTGEAEGERRALDAAEAAISNPLLEDTSMAGARGVLINITGGQDMTLFEADEAANRIRSEVDDDAYIIFGSTFDNSLEGRIRVSVVATGMDGASVSMPDTRIFTPQAPVRKPLEIEDEVETADVSEVVSPAFELAENITVAEEKEDLPEEVLVQDDLENAIAEQDTEAESASAEEETARDVEAVPAGTPAPATPGLNTEDAFIPSAPVNPGSEDGKESADPFAAAAMANGSRQQEEPQKTKSVTDRTKSLFERVTGLGNTSPRPQAEAPVEAPIPLAKPASAPAPEATVQELPSIQPKTVQEDLGGLNSDDRIPTSQQEDDLLDIPAFLRRQAN